MTLTTLGYAFIGGLLPSLIWLYFLLKEDARCPEPERLIALAFIAGMAAVPLVLPFEQFAEQVVTTKLGVFISWAAIEEVAKYVMATIFILWRRAVNEPIDYVIYMLTVALGFAAAENMLYLVSPLSSSGGLVSGIATDDLRFLGSTLLHVVASSTVGLTLAYASVHRRLARIPLVAGGLILAVVLHTSFNVLIMRGSGFSAVIALFFVWSLAVALFAAIEITKYFEYRDLPPNICPP